MQRRIPAVYMRGGTSKGVFFHTRHLPHDADLRDRVILAVLGSPDPNRRQINGLGGATSSTSKVVMINPSGRPDHDVDYTFGQVSIDSPFVDYNGNCGNLSSGVGPFAVDEGLVQVKEPSTQVRIYQVNTQKTIVAEVPVRNGLSNEEGTFSIDGIPGTGGEIRLRFLDPGGSKTGALLPTGSPLDTLDLGPNGRIEVSIVDAANPAVFVRAHDIGLQGTENADGELGPRAPGLLEDIRRHAACRLGFASTPEEAGESSQAVPKIVFCSSPQTYADLSGRLIEPGDIDLTARVISMGALHKAFAVTAAICTAGAAQIEGTVVHELARIDHHPDVRVGHPGGVLPVGARVTKCGDRAHFEEAVLERTARRLMEGSVLVPAATFFQGEEYA